MISLIWHNVAKKINGQFPGFLGKKHATSQYLLLLFLHPFTYSVSQECSWRVLAACVIYTVQDDPGRKTRGGYQVLCKLFPDQAALQNSPVNIVWLHQGKSLNLSAAKQKEGLPRGPFCRTESLNLECIMDLLSAQLHRKVGWGDLWGITPSYPSGNSGEWSQFLKTIAAWRACACKNYATPLFPEKAQQGSFTTFPSEWAESRHPSSVWMAGENLSLHLAVEASQEMLHCDSVLKCPVGRRCGLEESLHVIIFHSVIISSTVPLVKWIGLFVLSQNCLEYSRLDLI